MTTRVLVTNLGPDVLRVAVMNPNPSGDGWVANMNPIALHAGSYMEYYVYDAQQITITEEGK